MALVNRGGELDRHWTSCKQGGLILEKEYLKTKQFSQVPAYSTFASNFFLYFSTWRFIPHITPTMGVTVHVRLVVVLVVTASIPRIKDFY